MPSLQAQQSSGLPLTRFATRTAITVYDKQHNLSAVLRLFEKAVDSKEADTDIYTDTMASCFASRKFEVWQQLLMMKLTELLLHVCNWLIAMLWGVTNVCNVLIVILRGPQAPS